jgi:hypothetical protein
MAEYVPTEAQEAEVLVAYMRVKQYKFTHIPNETGHTQEARRRAVRMKRQGVSRGFIDYLVIVGDQMIGIELKRRTGGKASPEQIEWVKALNAAGIPTRICKGAQAAIEFIESIKGEKPHVEDTPF